ncbi:ankyrin repeat domain-containing protein [Rhodotorula paludigena]|uniref:ankyrin repeat domain-containing protein n=1 Tax=Rhodotorula paludigena TaxID=86838 RepID=UPI00317E4C3B
MSNIWLAAGEGAIDRVRELLDQGTSPNALDDNSYSPLHAAASWGHSDILRLLVERGGDINLADSDGDTPLYVVESVAMAKLVVELGGDAKWRNEEGVSPAQALQEEYPHISLYLRTLTGETGPSSSSSSSTIAPSSAAQPQPDLDAPTDALMQSVRAIMERAERGELSEAETDAALREVVEQTVSGQVAAGRAIGEQMALDEEGQDGGEARTRARTADELAGEQGKAKRTRDGDDIGR